MTACCGCRVMGQSETAYVVLVSRLEYTTHPHAAPHLSLSPTPATYCPSELLAKAVIDANGVPALAKALSRETDYIRAACCCQFGRSIPIALRRCVCGEGNNDSVACI